MVKDPVCGMQVDEKSTPHVSTLSGTTYYFCSVDDKKKFDAKPEVYVTNSAMENAHISPDEVSKGGPR